MLRGGSAPVSVLVFSVCLLTVTLQAASRRRCSQDIILRVRLLNNATAETPMDCTLYTPTIQDYENCPITTLKCYAAEIKVLTEELALSGLKHFLNLNVKLEKLATLFKQESGCRQCEVLTEKNATTFLTNLLWTLKTVNAQYC
ncbi:interleukin 15, like isoform 2-T2 [Odontesthes bonariensis]|uniref:interleukin 15, like isoform X2 n=1 Tax=Odontesthes bonariensis TaxID=219752 RepID=UPI003F583B93